MKIEYDSKKRWISYWYQIREVLRYSPKTLLEVGIGNKIVSLYFKRLGIDVTTVDKDKHKHPDYVLDVRDLRNVFDEDEFDIVLCAEVLEHLPYSVFPKALEEISVVGRDAVLTLPHRALDMRLTIDFDFPKIFETLNLKIPLPWKKTELGEHEWEIGDGLHSLQKVSATIKNFFNISRSYCIPENLWHRVFLLESRNEKCSK